MPRNGIRVSLKGHVHELVGDEHTACGLPVPHGTDWSDEPVDCPKEVKAKAKDDDKA
jgi:hypothetical protein